MSILIHAAIALAFLVNIPARQATPEQEQAVNVELVPPPPEKKPEEKKPEEAKKEEKKPEEPKPPEKPPEPPKAEAKKEEPPPPPPPPPPKEEAKEQPKPEAPREVAKEQPKPEPPKQEGNAQLATMPPVQEFGEKDTGPEISDKGDSATAEVGSETEQGDKQPSDEPAAEVDPPKPLEKPASASPLPKGINLPQVDTAAIQAGNDGPTTLGTDEAKTNFEAEKAPAQTKPAQSGPAEAQQGELKRAKTLYSRTATSDPRAQTAMGSLSRGQRFGQLCWTELRAQLQHSGYGNGQITVPIYLGPDGSNVLQVKYGAFRNNYGWFHQNFRCEVNQAATKIVSFAFAVGSPVARSEWDSLRITSD